MRNLLFIFFIVSRLFSQTLQITDILDTNKLKTKDGKIFKLAGICTPSLTATDSVQQAKAELCMQYARNHLLHHLFRYEPIDSVRNEEIPRYHLFRVLTIGKISVNEEMLQDGIGKYSKVSSSKWDKRFRQACKRAQKNNNGIWNEIRFNPPPLSRFHHRWRLMGWVLFEEFGEFNEPFFIPNFNYRWSFLERGRFRIRPFVEIGDNYLVFPYAKTGIEAGFQRGLFVETHVGFFGLLLPGAEMNLGSLAGCHLGFVLTQNNRIHFEAKFGGQWINYFDLDTVIPSINFGFSGW